MSCAAFCVRSISRLAHLQAGKVNSVAAMHDARSKQVPLNPLRARKGGTGVSANPVIRQQSIADMLQVSWLAEP